MKKMLSLVLCLILTLAFAVAGLAAEESKNTDSKVTFIDGPVIPDPPPGPEDPFWQFGSMSLDFGKHSLTGSSMTLNHKELNGDRTQKNTLKPALVVVNDMTGKPETRWTLKVKLGQFTDGTSTNSLPNAHLTFKPVDIASDSNAVVWAGNDAALMASHMVNRNTVNLTQAATDSVVIMTCNAASGSPGRWGGKYYADLYVPATATAKDHVAQLLWTAVVD